MFPEVRNQRENVPWVVDKYFSDPFRVICLKVSFREVCGNEDMAACLNEILSVSDLGKL